MSIVSKAIYRFKIPRLVSDLGKRTLKCVWKEKRSLISKAFIKSKNKSRGITISDIKPDFRAVKIKSTGTKTHSDQGTD